jgi:hypothetical protein
MPGTVTRIAKAARLGMEYRMPVMKVTGAYALR